MGHNRGQKQEIDLGKKTNQNFVQIPEYLLRKMIIYKCEEIGISVIEQEEIIHRNVLSQMKNLQDIEEGIIINADVQGGYNI